MAYDGPQLSDEWDVRLEAPTDRMFEASGHWIPVRDVTVGQHTLYAADAFSELSGLLDHIRGVVQFARGDPDSGLSLRLTGVYKPPCDAPDEAVEARFSAQVLLPPPLDGGPRRQVNVLLQLLPLGEDGDRYHDSTEKLMARGAAIKALADALRALYDTKRKMHNQAGAAAAPTS